MMQKIVMKFGFVRKVDQNCQKLIQVMFYPPALVYIEVINTDKKGV